MKALTNDQIKDQLRVARRGRGHRARVLYDRIREHLAGGGFVLVANGTGFWFHTDPEQFRCRRDGVYMRLGRRWELISHWIIRFDSFESLTDKLFATIAREHLGIETLRTRHSDSLDFHDVSVRGVKDALLAAYQAGLRAASAPPANAVEALPIVAVTVRGGLIEDMDATQPAHVVVEDWDITDDDTGEKPARNVWKLDASLADPRAEKLRRLIADD